MPAALLQPGDLAVAGGGVHVLIYLGAHRWIEANPEDGRVVICSPDDDARRAFYNVPVRIVRWWVVTT